jgi:hypothetical protein
LFGSTLLFLTFYVTSGILFYFPFPSSLVLSRTRSPSAALPPPPQIKKNTAPHELKPSDILIDRFTAWKQIVKMLIGESRRCGFFF